jgi:transaldolase / glucose-6-phosphate isomerase
VAGALLGVHPFDQPDVESAKVATRAWIERAARGEELLAGARVASGPGVAAFAPRNVAGPDTVEASVARAVDGFLSGATAGEPCALLAFLPASPAVRAALARLRRVLAERFAVVTTLGLGPRYLHSTGQLHKGGPPRGRYLVFSRAAAAVPGSARVPVPGLAIGFAEVHAAQALGDFEALAGRGRRVLRLELAEEPAGALVRVADELAALPALR